MFYFGHFIGDAYLMRLGGDFPGYRKDRVPNWIVPKLRCQIQGRKPFSLLIRTFIYNFPEFSSGIWLATLHLKWCHLKIHSTVSGLPCFSLINQSWAGSWRVSRAAFEFRPRKFSAQFSSQVSSRHTSVGCYPFPETIFNDANAKTKNRRTTPGELFGCHK